jgi:hypothetical protein
VNAFTKDRCDVDIDRLTTKFLVFEDHNNKNNISTIVTSIVIVNAIGQECRFCCTAENVSPLLVLPVRRLVSGCTDMRQTRDRSTSISSSSSRSCPCCCHLLLIRPCHKLYSIS